MVGMMRGVAELAVLLMIGAGIVGCAAAPSAGSGCTAYTAFGVSPNTATADHSAAAPNNQQRFTAYEKDGGTGTGCVFTALAREVYPSWTSSDPLNVSVSSAKDETNGTAVCTGSTGSAVMLTATSQDVTKPQTVSVQMSCK